MVDFSCMSVEATGPASSAIRPCQGVVSWPITTFCCCMIFHGSNAASTRINPKARKMQLWNLEHKLKEWFLCFFLNSETFNHWRMKFNIPLRYPSKPKCLNRRTKSMRCREALSLQSRAQPRGIWLNLVVWVRKYSMHAISQAIF